MLTIQILTRDNAGTVGRCLESAARVADEIVVGDMGSVDGTLDICGDFGARVVRIPPGGDLSEARNSLLAPGANMYLEPWESVARGLEAVRGMGGCKAFYVVQGPVVSKQVRLWDRGRFVNPVFERVAGCGEAEVRPDVVIVSAGGPDARAANTGACRRWAEARPTSPEAHYYLACSMLAEGDLGGFCAEATKYLSMDAEGGDSSVLMNYYLSRVEMSRGAYGEASRRAMACLAARPTFAEFWCLLGDMLYSRGKFGKAREMYENARIIGSRRRGDDAFPIEVSKYGEYPRAMEEKCAARLSDELLVAKKTKGP